MRREQRAPSTEAPILSFESAASLRQWLEEHHATSRGIWIRIYKVSSGRPTVTFLEVLDEGLCFGWSESLRRSCDNESYLQQFGPRRRRGTTSERNRKRAARLIEEGRMTPAGFAALAIEMGTLIPGPVGAANDAIRDQARRTRDERHGGRVITTDRRDFDIVAREGRITVLPLL